MWILPKVFIIFHEFQLFPGLAPIIKKEKTETEAKVVKTLLDELKKVGFKPVLCIRISTGFAGNNSEEDSKGQQKDAEKNTD
mmetsp:Transcript_3486/g.5035  ORF Transcript_3486/g.5035 Transcript_3486/m.5035 type:complete len:82 (+) Transcript_3486:968-1213(+)